MSTYFKFIWLFVCLTCFVAYAFEYYIGTWCEANTDGLFYAWYDWLWPSNRDEGVLIFFKKKSNFLFSLYSIGCLIPLPVIFECWWLIRKFCFSTQKSPKLSHLPVVIMFTDDVPETIKKWVDIKTCKLYLLYIIVI